MGSTNALQEGMSAPSGVTMPEPDEPTGISPASPSTATHSNRSHSTILPPASTRHHSLGLIHTVPLRTPPRGQESIGKGRSTGAAREGAASTAVMSEACASGTDADCRLDAATEANQATRARSGPYRSREAPATALLHAGN